MEKDNSNLPKPENPPKLMRFEVKVRHGLDGVEKAIFIDDKLLDWSVDKDSLMKAQAMGPEFYRAALRDIEKHFADSVSEFIGRKVIIEEVQKAIETGWI